ncbi:MAG: GIY-YIG nuclease family protein [Candidatus Anammoxibacter sp.]
MNVWPRKHSRFVGRVIFANFIDIPVKRHKNIIKEVENSSLFKKLLQDKNTGKDKNLYIVARLLSNAPVYDGTFETPDVVAQIFGSSKGFSIRYVYEGFNRIYTTHGNLDSNLILSGEHSEANLLHKLKRISSRNELTHRIIEGIIEHQMKFLNTCEPIDLKSLSQVQLAGWINKRQTSWQYAVGSLQIAYCHLPSEVCNTWISRIVNGHSVIIPSGEEMTLRSFFPTQKDIKKSLIKQVLDKENDSVLARKCGALTDSQIRGKIEKEYGVSISTFTVCQCRKDMGIPPAKKRTSGNKYPPLSANFSLIYPLTRDSTQNNAPASPGIYEIQLKNNVIKYPNGIASVIYIGRTKNIRKRIKEHMRVNNKNSKLSEFVKEFDCSFRYVSFSEPHSRKNGNLRAEERKLYELFVTTYGVSPECNRVIP